MTFFAHIAIATWFLAVLALFMSRRPAVAVVAGLVSGWLFLPVAGYAVTGLHTKAEIVALGVLVASLIFAPDPWARLRLSILDLPAALAVLAAGLASLSNDLGAYNAGSATLAKFLKWGVPYLLGRVYLSSPGGIRTIALGLFAGGLAYVPFCLWEIRMSPQLHRTLYGFHQHDIVQTFRFGGFRPMVFMQHGLAVGLWMTTATLAGYWLWRTRAKRALWGVPTGWLVAGLLATTLLVKSTGALILLVAGLAALAASRGLRTMVPVVLLALIPPSYVLVRATGTWSGRELVEWARPLSPDRAFSMRVRIDNEDQLVSRALERPVFGWGGFGRAEVPDEEGRSTSTRDGLWVIELGEAGLFGLVTYLLLFLGPSLLLARRFRSRATRDPALVPAVLLATLLPLVAIDNLFNGFSNPIYTASAGALVGLVVRARAARRGVRRRAAARAAEVRARPPLRPVPDPASHT